VKSKLIGAGLIAGATWVAYNRLSEPTLFDSPYADAASQILIVGGGFGGLAAARELGHALGGRQDVGVALLDRVNYTTFWPLVPSVISTNVEVRHVAHSIRPILKPLGVLVDEFLRVKSRSGVYAVEDFTSIDYNGPPVPALAQTAEQEGKSAALNLAAEVKGEAPVPFCYRTLGQLVDLGEDSALVNILGTKASGLVGALIWKGVYLYELDYNINRAQVIADWIIDMFARPDTSKLFEDGTRPATGR
jgi:NADH dehydrogenase FAD-containing subunit